MDPKVDKAEYVDGNFEFTVTWTTPDGKLWYTKGIYASPEGQLSLYLFDVMLKNTQSIIGRKLLEYTQVTHD